MPFTFSLSINLDKESLSKNNFTFLNQYYDYFHFLLKRDFCTVSLCYATLTEPCVCFSSCLTRPQLALGQNQQSKQTESKAERKKQKKTSLTQFKAKHKIL